MMGINIPDMVQIIKEHGLIPVPVDYDLETMSPKSIEEIKEAVTDKVRFTNSDVVTFRQNACCSHICLALDTTSLKLHFGVRNGTSMCLRMSPSPSLELRDLLVILMHA